MRFGVEYPTLNPVISGQAVIKDKFVFQLLFLLGTHEPPTGSPDKLDQRQFAFGLNYRFGFTEKPILKKNDWSATFIQVVDAKLRLNTSIHFLLRFYLGY